MEPSKQMICIVCPKECGLTLYSNPQYQAAPYSVEGYSCKRGLEFAIQEITNPSRVLTTTIAVCGGTSTRLPVRSSAPVPKNLAFQWLDAVKKLSVMTPVQMGDVLLRDVLQTRTDVLASRSIAP